MSRIIHVTNNKHIVEPKVPFEQYLYNPREPGYNHTGNTPPLHAKLHGSTYSLRRQFKHVVKKMKSTT